MFLFDDGVGGGSAFLAYKDLGDGFDESVPACFVFFKVEIISCTPIALFDPVHGGSAS